MKFCKHEINEVRNWPVAENAVKLKSSKGIIANMVAVILSTHALRN